MKEDTCNYIKIIFISTIEEVAFNCHINDKLCDLFDIFCQIKKINLNSVFFIYNGKSLSKYDNLKTIGQIVNEYSKRDKLINILVNNIPKQVNIVFSYLNLLNEENVDVGDCVGYLFNNFLSKNNINRNSVILKYKDNIVDTDLTINQFINKYSIDIGDWNEIDDNQKPIEIKLDVIEYLGVNKKILFIYNDDKYENFYNIEKKMKDIFSDYAKDQNKNENKLIFKYKGKSIDNNQTLMEFLQNNKDKINEEEENQTAHDINISSIKYKENKIIIHVADSSFCRVC